MLASVTFILGGASALTHVATFECNNFLNKCFKFWNDLEFFLFLFFFLQPPTDIKPTFTGAMQHPVSAPLKTSCLFKDDSLVSLDF